MSALKNEFCVLKLQLRESNRNRQNKLVLNAKLYGSSPFTSGFNRNLLEEKNYAFNSSAVLHTPGSWECVGGGHNPEQTGKALALCSSLHRVPLCEASGIRAYPTSLSPHKAGAAARKELCNLIHSPWFVLHRCWENSHTQTAATLMCTPHTSLLLFPSHPISYHHSLYRFRTRLTLRNSWSLPLCLFPVSLDALACLSLLCCPWAMIWSLLVWPISSPCRQVICPVI